MAEHRNHSCGDDITLGWIVENGIITQIGYEIKGCMMHKASASILCSKLKGASLDEADETMKMIKELTDASIPMPPTEDPDWLALADIRNYPTRLKCVMLSWEAISKNLHREEEL